jgi:large subunit ribosomal protein L24e
MAISREKHKTHRRKVLEAKKISLDLVQPTRAESSQAAKISEKIKVSTKPRTALVPGEGRSMGMDID